MTESKSLPALIALARKLDAEATKGPWTKLSDSRGGYFVYRHDGVRFMYLDDDGNCEFVLEADARFIATSRSLLIELAEAAERMHERIKESDAVLRELVQPDLTKGGVWVKCMLRQEIFDDARALLLRARALPSAKQSHA